MREIPPAGMAVCIGVFSIVNCVIWGKPWASAWDFWKCLVTVAVLALAGYLVQRRVYRPPAG